MATQGKGVSRESGKRGVLTTGKSAIFNSDDVCAECCGGGNVYLGGRFINANGVPCLRAAYYDADADQIVQLAQGVGNPFNDGTQVFAMAAYQGLIIMGGTFQLDGLGAALPFLAEYDPAGGTLAPFSGGVPDNAVLSMDVRGSDLYISGIFGNVGGVPCNRIAKWDGLSWTNLSSTDPGTVNAVGVSKVSNRIWAGGAWTPGFGPGASASTCIAYSDNDGASWAAMPSDSLIPGICNSIEALVDPTGFINGGNEYVCFGTNSAWVAPFVAPVFNYNAGGANYADSATNQYFPMFYDSLPQLGSQPYYQVNVAQPGPGSFTVKCFENHADLHFMGGIFIQSALNSGFGNASGDFVTVGWAPPTLPPPGVGDWGALNPALSGGANGDVNAIKGAIDSDLVFIAGAFTNLFGAGGTNRIGKYDPATYTVTSLDNGVDDLVNALAVL